MVLPASMFGTSAGVGIVVLRGVRTGVTGIASAKGTQSCRPGWTSILSLAVTELLLRSVGASALLSLQPRWRSALASLNRGRLARRSGCAGQTTGERCGGALNRGPSFAGTSCVANAMPIVQMRLQMLLLIADATRSESAS